ncbi:MAG: Hsp33 family molecular chaperone HslO [Mycoplasmatales bacterium]
MMIQGLAYNDQVRFFLFDSTNVVEEINQLIKPEPVAIDVLGRSMSITAIMAHMLKGDEKLSTTLDCSGPLNCVHCFANSKGYVKAGINNAYDNLEGLNIKQAIGNGSLRVIKNLKMKEPFVGEVELIQSDVVNDYAYYFVKSEQVPTAICCNVLINDDHSIKKSGALLIQLLPEADEEIITKLEEVVKNFDSIAQLLLDNTKEEILMKIFDDKYTILKEYDVQYKCDCSKENFINGLQMLGNDDLISIKKEKTIEVVCEYCKKTYNINTGEI